MRSFPITFPSCGGPSGGGDIRMAERRTGSTEVTLAEYVYGQVMIGKGQQRADGVTTHNLHRWAILRTPSVGVRREKTNASTHLAEGQWREHIWADTG